MIGSSTGRELPPRWREQTSGGESGSATAEARAAALFRAELAPRPASPELLAEIRMRPVPARPRAALLPLRWVVAGGILALSGGSFAAYHAVQAWRAPAPGYEPLPAPKAVNHAPAVHLAPPTVS